MKKLFVLSILFVAPFMVSAQGTTSVSSTSSTTPVVFADPGLAPGDFFYFLDQWGEGMRSFFAFSAEQKAKLAMEYAEERVAEIHAVIDERGINAPEAEEARNNFGKEVAWAATVIAREKEKGADVSALAKEVDDKLADSKEMLKEAYREHHNDLKNKQKDIETQIISALASKDVALEHDLKKELEEMNEESLKTLEEEGSVEDDFDDEEGIFEEAMGAERSAEAHITNIDRKYEKAKQEATEKGVLLDGALMEQYTELNAKADEAFKAGDFEAAKTYAKEAQDVLHDAEQEVDTDDLEEDFFGDSDDKGVSGQKGGSIEAGANSR